jgi:peptidyl-prolyl cis-trans isomerase SurA
MSRYFKWKYSLFLLLLICSASTFAQDDNNIADEVVWVVGDEAILKSDVEAERLNAQYNGTKFNGDPYCIIPEQLAVQKLYLHQAELDSIQVTDGEVMKRVDMQVDNIIRQVGTKEKMEEYFNKSYTQIRENMRENVKEGLIVQKMQQHLVEGIKVTPSEVREYCQSMPKDSLPYIPTQVQVEILTREPKIPQSEIDDVKSRLREFTDEVNSGKQSFATLAILYSEDTNSARRGGELGFMGKGMLDPDFANVAFNLNDPKKVSKIVRSEYGYHIIQLIEKRGDRVNCRHILLKPHVDDKEIVSATHHLDSIADDIRKAKFSFEEATTVLSYDKDTRGNGGLMPNENTGDSKFEMDQLPSEVAKVIDKMNVGEVSRAFTMINAKGQEICAIVKLKSKTQGHKADLADDYQRLKDIVLNKLREKKLDQWILEKQKKTYVRINEKWNKCNFKYPGWIKK